MSRLDEMIRLANSEAVHEAVEERMDGKLAGYRDSWHRNKPAKTLPTERRYNGARLYRMRQYRLRRINDACDACGSHEPREVSHKIAYAAGGDDSDANLQWLCHQCHVRHDRWPA